MVNKTQFYKTKVALAVVLSLGLAACGDSDGDEGSTSTSNTVSQTDSTQNTVGSENELTVTVKGLVIDSNGNPIVGAAVWLGNTETMTSGGGQYEFTDINVTDVVGVNNEGDEDDDNTGHQSLTITVLGTDTYLGAIVTVTPEAQVNNTGGNGNTAGGGTDVNSLVTIQTFVSGYTVEAGTAVLPMLNAGTYGYVRDCRTGQPLADTADILSLDFVTVSEDADSTIGTQLTNSEDSHTIASDADGMFSLATLAANSSYTISAKQGWAITSGLGFTTSTDTTVAAPIASALADGTYVTTSSVTTAGTTVTTVTTDVVDTLSSIVTTAVTTTAPVTSVTTASENSSEFLGTIEVCPVSFVPVDLSAAPYIKAIDGQIGSSTIGTVPTVTTEFPAGTTGVSAQYAAMNQGEVNDFVIWFSEEMASTFDMSEARVKVIAPGGSVSETVADATVTLSAEGTSATVSFATDLAEGSKVDVWFPHWTAKDANDDLFIIDNGAIRFDSVAVAIVGQDKATYTHAYFCTFSKPVDTASVTLGPQLFNADLTEDGNSTDLSDYSLAFQDNDDADNTAATVITQLNESDADSDDRLTALALARGVTVTIDQDYAVVAYDGTNAASLIWKHNTTTVVPGTTAGYDIVGTGANTELHIATAAHNDTVTVTPVNGFGDVLTAGAMSVTLVDAIAPTTVLQESYAITATGAPFAGQDVVSGTTANAAFGNGGEISAPGTTATASGEPIIYIQPRHLAGKVGNTNVAAREDEFDSLVAGMSGRLSAAELAAYGTPALAQAAVSIYTTAGGVQSPIYDATAIAAWEDVEATIGVAFNENVTLTTTPPAFGGATTLTGYAVNNNVAVNVDNLPSVVDLVTFDTASVVALSLDAGADLGFVGSVTDSRGNVSTANAQVFIQDAFPPMMTAAVWNGETLTLTFNEVPVIPSPAASINVIDPTNVAAAYPVSVSSANASVAGNVMTITLTGPQNVDLNARFVNGVAGEFLYNDDADVIEEQHALIDWDVIEDATGNSWSDFNSTLAPTSLGLEGTPSATRRWEVVAPRFLAVDSVGAFNYSLATTLYLDEVGGGTGDTDGIVTYTITFSHPLEMVDQTAANPFAQQIAAAGTSYDTPAERAGAISVSTINNEGVTMMNTLFTIDLDAANAGDIGTFVLDAAVFANTEETKGSFSLSADHKVITLTLRAAADGIDFGGVNATTFGLATQTNSAITGDLQSATPNIPWQNVN